MGYNIGCKNIMCSGLWSTANEKKIDFYGN